MTYIPKCSFFDVCSMCKKLKKFIAPFSRNFDQPLFSTRGVIKRVDPSKVGGRVFGVITILPLYYFVVREGNILLRSARK